jgi:hypothetical protein
MELFKKIHNLLITLININNILSLSKMLINGNLELIFSNMLAKLKKLLIKMLNLLINKIIPILIKLILILKKKNKPINKFQYINILNVHYSVISKKYMNYMVYQVVMNRIMRYK